MKFHLYVQSVSINIIMSCMTLTPLRFIYIDKGVLHVLIAINAWNVYLREHNKVLLRLSFGRSEITELQILFPGTPSGCGYVTDHATTSRYFPQLK